MGPSPDTTAAKLVSDAPYARVVRRLREMIVQGSVSRGEMLPSERKLAEQLGVGRTTVRRALETLSEEGLVARKTLRSRVVSSGDAAVSAGGGDVLDGFIGILLADMPEAKDTPHHQEWRRYVSLGSFDAVRAAGRHSLGLNVDELSEAGIDRLARASLSGVIVPEVGHRTDVLNGTARRLKRAGVHVVAYGGHPDLIEFDRVLSDHQRGSYLLTRWLIGQGRRHIVQAWPKPWDKYWLISRQRGYEQAMREAGLTPLPIFEIPECHPTQIEADFHRTARLVAGHFLDLFGSSGQSRGPRPDALLLGTDRELSFVSAALRMHGLSPGGDVVLCGYDNFYTRCTEQTFEPAAPAATIDKLNESSGHDMVALLLERLSGALSPQPQSRVIEPRLIVPAEGVGRT